QFHCTAQQGCPFKQVTRISAWVAYALPVGVVAFRQISLVIVIKPGDRVEFGTNLFPNLVGLGGFVQPQQGLKHMQIDAMTAFCSAECRRSASLSIGRHGLREPSAAKWPAGDTL